MRGRRILNAILAIVLAMSCAKRETPAARDVVLITIDTLRADALGYAGNTRVKTPYIDSLAAKGVVFTEAHAHNVVTLPSHSNILSGLLPWQHGIRDNAGFTFDASKPTLASVLKSAGFATGAFVSAFPLDHKFGLTRGFDTYDDHYPAALKALDFAVQERPGSETAAAASSWWQTHTATPRFLWMHIYEPHAPYVPPPPFREEYKDNPYLGEVAATDAILRSFLEPLLRQNPDTLVVITADHGESLGEHGELTHGLFAYEATLKVPMIVIDPGRAHSVDGRFVGHIDIAPTIAARVGATPSAEWKGKSLFDSGTRAHTYFESLSASLNRGWAPLVGLISEGKKLIELPEPELYDLANDPKETKNLFASDRRTSFALRKLLADDAPARAVGERSVSTEDQGKLLALGYISGASTKTTYTKDDDPKNLVGLDAQLHQAIAAYQQGNLSRALELMRALVAQRPDMQIGQEMLAFLLGQNERPDEAIAVLRRNVAEGRGGDPMKIRLGLMLSETGHAREAVEVLRPISDRNDATVLNALGIAYADSGNIEEAVKQFQRVLAFDPDNAVTFQNLGIVALRNGQIDLARRYLEKALSIDSKMPLALNTLGVAQAQSGNYEAAMTSWSRAVELDRDQLDALYNLGLVAMQLKRADVARKALNDYLERAPESRYAAERARARQLLRTLS